MRASAVSFAYKLTAAILAALLTFTLVPFAYADGEGSSAVEGESVASGLPDQSNGSTDSSFRESQAVSAEQDTEGSPVAPMLASGLAGKPSSFVSSDVALDSEPVIGSFTVDGLTYAVTDESHVELVGIAPSVILSGGSEAATPSVTLSGAAEGGVVEGSNSNQASEAGLANLALPETVTYEGATYTLTSIAPCAFYLSGVTSVTLPASVSDVDDRAFRSSDVASVEVAEGNPTYSSFDGVLYDAEQLSLLLIPEGKQGTVRIPKTAEVVEASVFSHCPLVDSISVDAGSAAFASENGLLYDSDLTTLLRVPAGATEITIREGCTTIAAGALEACAKLTTINAPATVTSISPDVFHAIPTVSLPAAALTEKAPQLTAMVALSSTDIDLPDINPSAITVNLPSNADAALWELFDFQGAMAASEPDVLQRVQGNGFAVKAVGKGTFSFTYWSKATGIEEKRTNQVKFGVENTGAGNFDATVYPGGSMTMTCSAYRYTNGNANASEGYTFKGYNEDGSAKVAFTRKSYAYASGCQIVYAVFEPNSYRIILDVNGGSYIDTSLIDAVYDSPATLPEPIRHGYSFAGWDTEVDGTGERFYEFAMNLSATADADVPLYAQWEGIGYNIGFDVDSEPGDENCKGEPKEDQTVSVEDGLAVIEDPKRPGYVFQGWVIPEADGGHALDQNLVYEGDDGKWYVDASKLPDYAGSDGRVELTARWTSVISVDVPSVATFYYDLVTDQSAEAHEAALSGTTSFSSKSAVDLRVCGLESKKAAGVDSLFSKGADADGLLSVYPASGGKAVTLEGAQGIAGAKPTATAVDFALDDIVLEAAFAKAGTDAYKIPAGDKLTLTYRLNLGADAKLDYDKVLAMEEGKPTALALLTYTFAADLPAGPFPTGNKTDPLWVENTDSDLAPVGIYGLADIKAAANDMASYGNQPQESSYYKLYQGLLDDEADFQLKVNGTYHPVRLLGLCADELSGIDGKAGMTFGFRDVFAAGNLTNSLDGSRPFDTALRDSNSNEGSWEATSMRSQLDSQFMAMLEPQMRERGTGIVPVSKHQQITGGNSWDYLQTSLDERIWIPSVYEVSGQTFPDYNAAEEILAQYRHPSYANLGIKTFDGQPCAYWLRGAMVTNRFNYSFMSANGSIGGDGADQSQYGILPCFCL